MTDARMLTFSRLNKNKNNLIWIQIERNGEEKHDKIKKECRGMKVYEPQIMILG